MLLAAAAPVPPSMPLTSMTSAPALATPTAKILAEAQRGAVPVAVDGAPAPLGWVTLPRVARCTLRASPDLDCYP